MINHRSPFQLTTGILLIAAPILAWVLKSISAGWVFLALIIMGLIIFLAAGYIFQVIIAVLGFFVRRDLYGSRRKFATSATWLTSVGVLALSVFVPDGGDTTRGSTFQVWMGSYGRDGEAVLQATDSLNNLIFFLALILWLGGYLWLVIETILGFRRSRLTPRVNP